MRPYAGKLDIVHNNNPRMMNCLEPAGLEKSCAATPCQRACSSQSSGRKNTSKFFEVGECFPEMRMLNEIKNFLVTNHGSKL
jgi:hypothetical protein